MSVTGSHAPDSARVTAGAPPTELLRALAHFAEPPGPAHERLAGVLGLPNAPSGSAYADVFLFQLHPYASVHLGPEGMVGGQARARVSGFWSAVGRDVPAEPDHLAALVGLYASLAEEEAGLERSGPDVRMVERARRALLVEHLAPWVFAYLGRVEELAGRVYAAWARLLGEVLRGELASGGGPCTRAGAHLEDVPPLDDPRESGAGAFLASLLAPARAGAVLTRADLARAASELRLGLRAGERRYALEHLLGQDAAGTLRHLAKELDRQAAAHEARAPWLGAPAALVGERARTAARLLRMLAESGTGGPGAPGRERADSRTHPPDGTAEGRVS